MGKKRSGLKGKHVEITGEGTLDDATYDLQVTTSLFWLSSSEELLRSASVLEDYQNTNLKNKIVGNNVFSTVRLLSGYALENIFKAIIAPQVKSKKSGKLPEELKSHKLKELCKKAEVKITDEQEKILEFLTDHVEAYGRYHVHLSAGKMKKNVKIGAGKDFFSEVVKIWTEARSKLPGYRHI